MRPGNTESPAKQNDILSRVFREDEKLCEKYLRSPESVTLISGGGSDRSFYRIKQGKRTVILMLSQSGNREFKNYLETDRFLSNISIGVPEIYDVNLEKCFLFMEDAGDESLYDKFQTSRSEAETLYWYKKVLAILTHMQVEGGRKCSHLNLRIFDYHALRKETKYFQEYFIERYCGISISDKEKLAQEFRALAKKVAKEPLHFMHRDFQSQNIMIKNGEIRVIDFQGGRKGLLQYDLVSILKDAYVVLSEKTRKKLILFYLEKLGGEGLKIKDHEQFYEVLTLTGLQRNMQALGAFSFLSLVKGKPWFKQYIPAGVQYLYSALEQRKEFPRLSALIKQATQMV